MAYSGHKPIASKGEGRSCWHRSYGAFQYDKTGIISRDSAEHPRASSQAGNGDWWGVGGVLLVARVHDGIIPCISPEKEYGGRCNI